MKGQIMPNITELPPEKQKELMRQSKIAHLRWLQKQYRMMENGASPRDISHLRVGQQVLEGRIERIEMGGR